jgi:hypothetical protein
MQVAIERDVLERMCFYQVTIKHGFLITRSSLRPTRANVATLRCQGIRRFQKAIILLSQRFLHGMPGEQDCNRRTLAPEAAPKGGPVPGALALQPGEICRSLGGFRCGGEDRFLVFLHDRQPMSEILRVIGAGFVGDPKIGAEEGGSQLGDLS